MTWPGSRAPLAARRSRPSSTAHSTSIPSTGLARTRSNLGVVSRRASMASSNSSKKRTHPGESLILSPPAGRFDEHRPAQLCDHPRQDPAWLRAGAIPVAHHHVTAGRQATARTMITSCTPCPFLPRWRTLPAPTYRVPVILESGPRSVAVLAVVPCISGSTTPRAEGPSGHEPDLITSGRAARAGRETISLTVAHGDRLDRRPRPGTAPAVPGLRPS